MERKKGRYLQTPYAVIQFGWFDAFRDMIIRGSNIPFSGAVLMASSGINSGSWSDTVSLQDA